ncbi:MAG: carboxymuconolactone decarboxylase family protein [Clostridia bacterium]|nr:MAG: carboxymuconolactone decarboxylase family protein [Clostridia bacterium]
MEGLSVEQLLERMTKELGAMPGPMKQLATLKPEMVFEHARSKQFAFSGEAIPAKYKALINVAVAAALGSRECIVNQTRIALGQGATGQEIVEALIAARFVKSSTIFSTAEDALALLGAGAD